MTVHVVGKQQAAEAKTAYLGISVEIGCLKLIINKIINSLWMKKTLKM